MDNGISQMQPFQNREKFEAYIPGRILELTDNGKIQSPETVNAYPHDLENTEAFELVSGSISEGIKDSAMDFILDGKLVVQFLFAGAATRAAQILKGVSKYSFNIRGFKDNAQAVLSSCRREMEQTADDNEKNKILQEISALEKGLKEFSKSDLLPVTLGAREIFQYRLALEEFAKRRGRDIDKVLKDIFFIIHMNDDASGFICNDFLKNHCFGFERENILFIIQDTFEGYVFKDGSLQKVTGAARPFGHGYTLMQTVTPGCGMILQKNGSLQKVHECPLEHIRSIAGKNDMIMTNVNIDDLTKLTPLFLDVEKLSFVLKYINEEKKDIIVEGVWNIKGQKGGSWLRDKSTHKNMLVEGLCLKTQRFNPLFHKGDGQKKDVADLPLLNKMSNYYKVQSLLKHLTVSGLPNYLDVREGVFYLESITGDVTQVEAMESVVNSTQLSPPSSVFQMPVPTPNECR